MNNNYNNIKKSKERVLKNFYPVYHAPLVFDIGAQSCYRKAGYVAWPNKSTEEKEKLKSISGSGGYFAYPKK